MRKRTWILRGVILLVAGGAFGLWLIQGPEIRERDLTGIEGDLKRGAYVARLAGCIACHTDTKAGGKILAGGAEISTDFGNFYAPNITPDLEDGIGSWTIADFSRALTAGVSPEGNHYFPSFPFTFYNRLTDQDVVDLWVAVTSVPAVSGEPPKHGLRFPFGFHQGVAIWDRLYFEDSQLASRSDKSEQWNRGRYLAEGPAHCGACHTPRNILGARNSDEQYQGGVGPGGTKVPAITPADLKKNNWAPDDLVYALRTGIMPDGDVFGGSMVEVVRDGTRFWSNEDLEALVEYLFDLQPETLASSN